MRNRASNARVPSAATRPTAERIGTLQSQPHPCPFGKLRALSPSKGGTWRFSCPTALARGARLFSSLPPSLFELRRTSRARSCCDFQFLNRHSSGRLACQRKANHHYVYIYWNVLNARCSRPSGLVLPCFN
jgi:hypothetical protein